MVYDVGKEDRIHLSTDYVWVPTPFMAVSVFPVQVHHGGAHSTGGRIPVGAACGHESAVRQVSLHGGVNCREGKERVQRPL